MNNAAKSKVNRHVERKFPELKGARPSVKRQGSSSDQPNYLLVYKGKAELPGGKTMDRIVRVVADESGKIIRLSTSR